MTQIARIDAAAFVKDIQALRAEINTKLGSDDIRHLRKIQYWGWAATIVGLCTCWMFPNPLSIVALSMGRGTRWLLMHHISHRGYDRVPNIPKQYTSHRFARGWRRLIDWLDWMLPSAWNYEHNILHHGRIGQKDDPDCLGRELQRWGNGQWPVVLRYFSILLIGLGWRAINYAPKTLSLWMGRNGKSINRWSYYRQLWLHCFFPYILIYFIGFPLFFAPFGWHVVGFALINSLLADILLNLHTFCLAITNHTGYDLALFEQAPTTRVEYYIQQVVGSANYKTGPDLRDWLQYWLNYQIEHHIWPDLPLLKYQQFQPQVKAICERHGVTYVQEGLFRRLHKALAVIAGLHSMPRTISVLREPEQATTKQVE